MKKTIYTKNLTFPNIILDRVAPTSPGLIINNGELQTTNNVVRLSLSVDELYLREMKIGNDVGFIGAEWTSFVAEVDWMLTGLIGEEQTVYVKFKDAVGWESEVGEDSIMLVPEPGILWIVGLLVPLLSGTSRACLGRGACQGGGCNYGLFNKRK